MSKFCFPFLAVSIFISFGCAPKDPTALAPDVAAVRIEARGPTGAAPMIGRGFLVSADGVIVTSLHIVDGAQDITVYRGNGDQLFADLVQGDRDGDLAIIRVHAKNLPYLKMFTDDVEPGMHVRLLASVGTTHGLFEHWENFGSAMDVSVAMTPLDSGAPLLADDGRVLAIAIKQSDGSATDSTAMPISRVIKMMPSLKEAFSP